MTYSWRPATGQDVLPIVSLAQQHFETEIDTVFQPDPVAYSRNLTLAVVNQFYCPQAELVSVAEDDLKRIVAYTWAQSGQRSPWSDDNMIVVKIAHVDLTIPARHRITLVKDMIRLWEGFAILSNTPIVCSTTMRRDQTAFLKIHAALGYDVRGSYAYKRLSATQTGLPIP